MQPFFGRLLPPLGLALAALSSVPAFGSEAQTPAASSEVVSKSSPMAKSTALQPPQTRRDMFLPIVAEESKRAGLPPEIADAVCQIESAYNPSAIGGVGEIGLMQVLPTTAAMLGYQGSAAGLADPKTNIHFGVKYLAKAWELADGDLCRALMKYRAGHGEERFTPLSIDYCRRAREHLAAVGAGLPIPSTNPIAAKGRASGSDKLASRLKNPVEASYHRELRVARLEAAKVFGRARTVEDSARFWSAQQARIKAKVAALKGRARVAAR